MTIDELREQAYRYYTDSRKERPNGSINNQQMNAAGKVTDNLSAPDLAQLFVSNPELLSLTINGSVSNVSVETVMSSALFQYLLLHLNNPPRCRRCGTTLTPDDKVTCIGEHMYCEVCVQEMLEQAAGWLEASRNVVEHNWEAEAAEARADVWHPY